MKVKNKTVRNARVSHKMMRLWCIDSQIGSEFLTFDVRYSHFLYFQRSRQYPYAMDITNCTQRHSNYWVNEN
jgi:hypothetical protein